MYRDEVPPPPPPTFAERIAKWFPQLAAPTIEKLSKFNDELLKFNKTINLVSEQTLKKADVVHFADCIHATTLIEKHISPDAPLYDYGSGNGFPGIVMGILFPKVQTILVERDTKKAEFLKHVRSLLGLDNVEVKAVDTEDLPAGSVQNAMARDYAPLHKLLLSARHSVKAGGQFFHLKTDSWPQELASVPSQLFTVWDPSLLGQYSLPEAGGTMAVVITKKIG